MWAWGGKAKRSKHANPPHVTQREHKLFPFPLLFKILTWKLCLCPCPFLTKRKKSMRLLKISFQVECEASLQKGREKLCLSNFGEKLVCCLLSKRSKFMLHEKECHKGCSCQKVSIILGTFVTLMISLKRMDWRGKRSNRGTSGCLASTPLTLYLFLIPLFDFIQVLEEALKSL